MLSAFNHRLEKPRVLTENAAAKSLQSCPTLCDPLDGSPPGSPAPGILQARTPEWVAIAFSNRPIDLSANGQLHSFLQPSCIPLRMSTAFSFSSVVGHLAFFHVGLLYSFQT